MNDIVQELGRTPKQLVDELEHDLVKLINKHSFMGVSTLHNILTSPLAVHLSSRMASFLSSKERAALTAGYCLAARMQQCLEGEVSPGTWHVWRLG